MKGRTRPHVLLALNYWDERLLRGIAKVAARNGWNLDCRLQFRRAKPKPGAYDGVIALLSDQEMINWIHRLKVPIVDLTEYHDAIHAPKVTCDNIAVGRTAAAHYASCGLEHVGFVEFLKPWNAPNSPLEERRRLGFEDGARQAELKFHLLDTQKLRSQLRKLPQPIGLMACSDWYSYYVMGVCLDLELQIPEQIAILGVDDLQLFCEFAPVPLTSINLDFERRGFEAAALLDRLMKGEGPPDRALIIPHSLTPRQSTDIVLSPNPHVADALAYIRRNFREPISSRDVLNHVHASRQSLQRYFIQNVGRTILDEIMRQRLEEARRLMRHTDLKLEVVAELSGLGDRQHLHRAFTAAYQQPPAVWRQEQSSPAI